MARCFCILPAGETWYVHLQRELPYTSFFRGLQMAPHPIPASLGVLLAFSSSGPRIEPSTAQALSPDLLNK